jgi:hypothetical protein
MPDPLQQAHVNDCVNAHTFPRPAGSPAGVEAAANAALLQAHDVDAADERRAQDGLCQFVQVERRRSLAAFKRPI